ncbi:hypothetical protein [Nocardia sp. CA-119907]|uniref:hypothetical protein n=1 Tax=Nocardia sp. CA-119907 TaxID=3239973 RepID=UPI003D99716B
MVVVDEGFGVVGPNVVVNAEVGASVAVRGITWVDLESDGDSVSGDEVDDDGVLTPVCSGPLDEHAATAGTTSRAPMNPISREQICIIATPFAFVLEEDSVMPTEPGALD